MFTINFYTSDITRIVRAYTVDTLDDAEFWACYKLTQHPEYMLAEIWQDGVFLKAFD